MLVAPQIPILVMGERLTGEGLVDEGLMGERVSCTSSAFSMK